MADSENIRHPSTMSTAGMMEAPEEPPPEVVEKKPKKKKLTKAQKKELKRLREIEFKKTEMQGEFRRELELSRRTAKKLKTDWEETLREMKLIELKHELTAWEQKVMREFHDKDEKISQMMTLIFNLEDMNLIIAGRIKGFLDYLLDIYKSMTTSSKLLYEQLAAEAIVDFRESMEESGGYNQACRLHCENIMHTTNVIFEQEMLQDYNIFVERRNDNVNIAIQKRYEIRDSIVNKMKHTRQQLFNFIQQLSATNLDPYKYERIRQLMGRQRTFFFESQRLNEIEVRQGRLYNELQRELLQSEIKTQKKHNDLRLEQAFFMEIRRGIEQSIELDRMLTFEKLKVLSKETYIILKQFEKLRDYGEHLLSLAANVRKLQTEAEKVLVWGDFTPSGNKSDISELRKFVLTKINPNTHVDRNDEQFYNEMNLMRVFWRRMAIVETQNAMLRKEKLQLEANNKKYTDFIRTMNHTTEPEKLLDSLLVKQVLTKESKCPGCDP